ncbi:MAG: TonB-dependent receptor [Acidobacteriota bacterium]|nr:TonB-dependent receptor [Acidobacteriota bacterium]
MNVRRVLLLILMAAGVIVPALGQTNGRIVGSVFDANGNAVEAVFVSVQETGDLEVTDWDGRFSFASVAPGGYTLVFSLGDNSATEVVTVEAGETLTVEKQVTWMLSLHETVTVYGASRQRERIVDAPAAVTVVTEDEIEKQASHGQLPKLLEFTPGAEVTQSGIYDYNFNTRGFNSSLNRRVATLIDGRDPSVPFLGAQSWAAISFPLDDLATAELVRGPSAALYGANASSGVLNLVSKQPRYSRGGTIRLVGGEVGTFNADFRWAESLGKDWFIKLQAGLRKSGDFTVSRMGANEYSVPCPVPQGTATDCLPQEPVAPMRIDDNDITFGGVRIDKYFGGGSVFTVEGGSTTIEGPVFQTGIGRVQLLDVERPWARVNYTADNWNVLASYTSREAPRQLSLAAGTNLALDTERLQFEAQGHWKFGEKNHRIVVGGATGTEDIDSFDPDQGRQTLMFSPVENDKSSLYAQLDLNLNERFRLALASRWDDADIHDSQLSPKASLVYNPTPNQALRLTYNEAFQVGAYSELFLAAAPAPPLDLTGGTGVDPCVAATAGAFDCGLAASIPLLALGNDDLEVEETQLFEFGYTGLLGGNLMLTVDYYIAENENFITDLLPQVGTPLSVDVDGDGTLDRLNPNFGAWVQPAGVPAAVADPTRAAIGASLAPFGFELSNAPDGSPIIAARSYTNFGAVDTQGVDLGLKYFVTYDWSFWFNYSWFDFDIKKGAPGLDDLLLPNSPENKSSVGVSYTSGDVNGVLSARWVDDFRWVAGPFQGLVESYTTVDLSLNYRFDESWKIGLNVANLLDDDHFEAFGGDLVERRALAHVQFDWK